MITITPLMYVPIFKADAGFPPSLPLTSMNTDDGSDNTDSRNDQREDQLHRSSENIAVSDAEFTTATCCKCDSGNDGTYIGFEQVGTHTCNVTYIVAYVICDNSRVTRVIFRDSCFDLTYKVSTNVGCLRVDTAADSAEQRHGRSPETEACNAFNNCCKV